LIIQYFDYICSVSKKKLSTKKLKGKRYTLPNGETILVMEDNNKHGYRQGGNGGTKKFSKKMKSKKRLK